MRSLVLASLTFLLPVAGVYAHSDSQIKSIGNPLAPDLQSKPAVIQVKSRNCPMCRQMEPTVQQVKQKYKGRVTFITFDVSDSKSTKEAEKVAGVANLSSFFSSNRNNTGLILAVDPRTGQVIEQFSHSATTDNFSQVLDQAILSFAKK
jgi:thiol-disulfide isomerase/thioredoxin